MVIKTEKIDFETTLKRLEAIAAKLESNNTSLEEAVSLFEQGTALSKECASMLENARQKIIMLTDAEKGDKQND